MIFENKLFYQYDHNESPTNCHIFDIEKYAKIVNTLRGWNNLLSSFKQTRHSQKHANIYIFSPITSTLLYIYISSEFTMLRLSAFYYTFIKSINHNNFCYSIIT